MTPTKEMIDERVKQWKLWKALVKSNSDCFRIICDHAGNIGYKVCLEEWSGKSWHVLDRQSHTVYNDGTWL